jgi:hypothetical protein
MSAIGLAASWLGTLLWNQASRLLPTSLVGQLIVFETLSALAYGFAWRGEPPSGGAALNILTYVPLPPALLHVKGIYRVEQLNALAQVVAHKEGDLTVLHVVLHEGSELDVSASEWYAQDGPHDLFEDPPTPTHEKCTTDRKKLEELKKHAERWLAAYESAELYRKVENQAPDAAHIPQEDGDELEDGDLEVEIVSDNSDDEQ